MSKQSLKDAVKEDIRAQVRAERYFGDFCKYVDPKHPEALADAVRTLADDHDLCRRMGEQGKTAACERYDRQTIADQLMDTFETVTRTFAITEKA